MQSTLETVDQLTRRLNVAVPLASIEGEVSKRLARLAKTVKVPGFRPGHVPMKMVAQQYGPQVRSDVISDAVQSSFNDAVREQNLRVAGYPRIEPKADADTSAGALEFSAVFEVYPDVTLGDIGGLAIERPVVDVTAADVDRTLEVLRRQRATFAPRDGGAVKGDRVTVDFTGTIDGVEFAGGKAEDFQFALGEGNMLPEFDAAATGMKAGESNTFPLTFPADYHGKEVAGKTAEFTLAVKAVEAPQLPPLDTAFATAFGMKSGKIEDLRHEVEANLKLELKRKLEAVLKDAPGVDDPEKLKHRLYDEWKKDASPLSILLVGDADVLPVRYLPGEDSRLRDARNGEAERCWWPALEFKRPEFEWEAEARFVLVDHADITGSGATNTLRRTARPPRRFVAVRSDTFVEAIIPLDAESHRCRPARPLAGRSIMPPLEEQRTRTESLSVLLASLLDSDPIQPAAED